MTFRTKRVPAKSNPYKTITKPLVFFMNLFSQLSTGHKYETFKNRQDFNPLIARLSMN